MDAHGLYNSYKYNWDDLHFIASYCLILFHVASLWQVWLNGPLACNDHDGHSLQPAPPEWDSKSSEYSSHLLALFLNFSSYATCVIVFVRFRKFQLVHVGLVWLSLSNSPWLCNTRRYHTYHTTSADPGCPWELWIVVILTGRQTLGPRQTMAPGHSATETLILWWCWHCTVHW